MGGFLITAMIVSVGYALTQMNTLGNEIYSIAEQDIPLTRAITGVTVLQLEQSVNFERALRFGKEIGKLPSAEGHYMQAAGDFDTYSGKIEEELAKGERIAEKALASAHDETSAKKFEHVASSLKKIKAEHASYEEYAHKTFELLDKGDVSAALDIAANIEKKKEKSDHELEALLQEVDKFTADTTSQAEHDEQAAFKLLAIIALTAVVVGTLMSYMIIRSVSRGLQNGISVAEIIASGDLSQEVSVQSQDEIGRLLNALGTMRNNLHAMITEMGQAATELAAASEELSAISVQSHQSIQQQQSESEQAATAINEMTATIQEVSRNAVKTAESAGNANTESSNGYNVVKQTIDAIEQLANGVDNAANVIQQVGEDSNNIGSVLDVIKGVAEQTNLLALNAAIEAARAGEQGRGFAVVADEVRTLAQRTQESTLEIEEMISRLQTGAQHAVQAMNQGREQAQSSVEQAAKAGASLEIITRTVAEINDMNTQIASAVEEQTAVAEDINRNITSVAGAGEQNASAANQVTASSEELSRMANNLNTMISKFQI